MFSQKLMLRKHNVYTCVFSAQKKGLLSELPEEDDEVQIVGSEFLEMNFFMIESHCDVIQLCSSYSCCFRINC